jgi:hypothetical protein
MKQEDAGDHLPKPGQCQPLTGAKSVPAWRLTRLEIGENVFSYLFG